MNQIVLNLRKNLNLRKSLNLKLNNKTIKPRNKRLTFRINKKK